MLLAVQRQLTIWCQTGILNQHQFTMLCQLDFLLPPLDHTSACCSICRVFYISIEQMQTHFPWLFGSVTAPNNIIFFLAYLIRGIRWSKYQSLLHPTGPASKTQPPVLLKAVYSSSFSLQIPGASGYKRFLSTQATTTPQPITTGHITSPGRLAQPIRD